SRQQHRLKEHHAGVPDLRCAAQLGQDHLPNNRLHQKEDECADKQRDGKNRQGQGTTSTQTASSTAGASHSRSDQKRKHAFRRLQPPKRRVMSIHQTRIGIRMSSDLPPPLPPLWGNFPTRSGLDQTARSGNLQLNPVNWGRPRRPPSSSLLRFFLAKGPRKSRR